MCLRWPMSTERGSGSSGPRSVSWIALRSRGDSREATRSPAHGCRTAGVARPDGSVAPVARSGPGDVDNGRGLASTASQKAIWQAVEDSTESSTVLCAVSLRGKEQGHGASCAGTGTPGGAFLDRSLEAAPPRTPGRSDCPAGAGLPFGQFWLLVRCAPESRTAGPGAALPGGTRGVVAEEAGGAPEGIADAPGFVGEGFAGPDLPGA